jgi:hypothetical protein
MVTSGRTFIYAVDEKAYGRSSHQLMIRVHGGKRGGGEVTFLDIVKPDHLYAGRHAHSKVGEAA